MTDESTELRVPDNVEISEKILQILSDKSQDPATMKAKIQAILDHYKPRCNKCGSFEDEIKTHKIYWGFESTGKDTDCDVWNFCAECSLEFCTQYFPVCSMCHRSIPDVMAKLDHLNPRHIYYGDYPAALAHVCSMNHCGLEYAKVEDRIICEECYEDFLGSFQIPMQAGSYAPGCLTYYPGGGPQRNRIQNSLICDPRPALSAWLDWEELLEVKRSDKKHEKITHLTYNGADERWLELLDASPRVVARQLVHAQTGDNKFYSLPISWLQELANKAQQQLDVTRLRVTNKGETLHFGEFQLATKVVIEEGAQFKR